MELQLRLGHCTNVICENVGKQNKENEKCNLRESGDMKIGDDEKYGIWEIGNIVIQEDRYIWRNMQIREQMYIWSKKGDKLLNLYVSKQEESIELDLEKYWIDYIWGISCVYYGRYKKKEKKKNIHNI